MNKIVLISFIQHSELLRRAVQTPATPPCSKCFKPGLCPSRTAFHLISKECCTENVHISIAISRKAKVYKSQDFHCLQAQTLWQFTGICCSEGEDVKIMWIFLKKRYKYEHIILSKLIKRLQFVLSHRCCIPVVGSCVLWFADVIGRHVSLLASRLPEPPFRVAVQVLKRQNPQTLIGWYAQLIGAASGEGVKGVINLEEHKKG